MYFVKRLIKNKVEGEKASKSPLTFGSLPSIVKDREILKGREFCMRGDTQVILAYACTLII